jgi:signal-transduction protein with cAMP-binding, CBS, and nucleotidyltransferase domain
VTQGLLWQQLKEWSIKISRGKLNCLLIENKTAFHDDNPEIISPETTLKQAAEKMRDQNIGFLPIGENDRLIGAITDRDIVIRGVAEGKDSNKTVVRQLNFFMTPWTLANKLLHRLFVTTSHAFRHRLDGLPFAI